MKKEASGSKSAFTAFLLHLHPRSIPEETLRFRLSFGLGGMAVTLVVTLVLTGILQLLSYSPHPESAYLSIQQIYTKPALGGFIRNIHFWAGNLLVIITALHLLRVFFTGALLNTRKYNWLIGIVVIILVQFANFTGYLLPWDQLAFWAVTIFTNMVDSVPIVGSWMVTVLRGGSEVGEATLSNFFALHIGVIPACLCVLLIWHFWMVRKAGGLVQAKKESSADRKRIRVIPHLVVKEAATGLILLALLFLFAAMVDAPLAEPANPGESPNPAKAAWYFMGLQELLLHLHPTVAISIVPFLMLFGLASVPFFRGAVLPEGRWFGGSRGAKLALFTFVLSFIVTLLAVIADEILLREMGATGSQSTWLARGVIPLCVICLLYIGIYLFVKRRGNYSRAESVMAVVVVNIGCICSLSVVGIWLRGPGMKLIW